MANAVAADVEDELLAVGYGAIVGATALIDAETPMTGGCVDVTVTNSLECTAEGVGADVRSTATEAGAKLVVFSGANGV